MFHKFERIVALHYVFKGTFKVHKGTEISNTYVDVCEAILAHPIEARSFYIGELQGLWPVGTGNSGAMVLGLLGRGTLYDPKPWGRMWSNPPPPHTKVALVDDCAFSGDTLKELHQACHKAGLIVVKEVVAYDARDTQLARESNKDSAT